MTEHECPICGETCYCDGEDHHQSAPADCCHDCDEFAEFDAEDQ